MKLQEKHFEQLSNKAVSDDIEAEELNLLEEDEEIYKWLSVLLCMIWLLSLIVF